MSRNSVRLSSWSRFSLFLALLFISNFVCAQVSTTGKITGTVIDDSGAAVTGATVEVKSTALMQSRSSQTASDGSFLFDLLPPGAYQAGEDNNWTYTLIYPIRFVIHRQS